MGKNEYVKRTAKMLKKQMAIAERARSVKNRPADGIVYLKPTSIKMRPELFQVREFSYGLRNVDKGHVTKLERAIGTVGELDPPVVIKLGREWVCVDGHHRIEAYKRAASWKQIKCNWFGGTVREAVDESMLLNSKDRLNVPQPDRMEAAWKRVILDMGSKADIVKLCGVGEGSIAAMRRIKKAYEASDAGGELFRKRLSVKLDEATWMNARLTFAGVEAKEIDDEERAAKLARSLHSRMTNLLSRDPGVTARALRLYDPELPRALAEAWAEQDPRLDDTKDGHREPLPDL
jgi:hypothetical protein